MSTEVNQRASATSTARAVAYPVIRVRPRHNGSKELSSAAYPATIPGSLILGSGDAMRIRHYSKGKFYLIECPDGTRVVRAVQSSSAQAGSHDRLIVPFEGREIAIPADPLELMPLLAEAGRC